MKIEDIRPSFTAYVIAGEPGNLVSVAEIMGSAGFMVAQFEELDAAFSEFYSNPPHFLMFDANEGKFDVRKAIKQVVEQLPESHVFVVSPLKDREKVVSMLELGAYDLIFTPVISKLEVLRAVDHAAERDYFMYLNERLMEGQKDSAGAAAAAAVSATATATAAAAAAAASGAAPVTGSGAPTNDGNAVTAGDSPGASDIASASGTAGPDGVGREVTIISPALSEDFHLEYARKLFSHTTTEECLEVFLESSCHILGSCPAVFFRYVPNRRVLMAGQSMNVAAGYDLRGLGMDLNEVMDGFKASQLREPMKLRPFREMLQDVFEIKDFVAFPIEALGEVQGVACFLTTSPPAGLMRILQEWLILLGHSLSLVESSKRLHVVSTKDFTTDLLNRQTFIGKISEEISRARRTKFPVSLILIAVDQYGQLSSLFGQEEAQLILRTVAKILQKHSRVNDILGRTAVDEFGLILPHTDKKGAAIKAERLRRTLESADFSKILARFHKLTLSLGVSEYPTLSRDAVELLQSADEAVFQIRKAGNRTCIATAPEGFEPDFSIEPPKKDG